MKQLSGVFVLALLCTGCTPTLEVRPNPGPHDGGLRYYRPKPYLLLEPVAVETGAKDPVDKGARPRGDLFKISLQYLPDFSEEYAVNVRTGLGASKTKLTLEHGWNLTSVDLDYDSKASENLNAVSNLLKAATPDGLIAGTKSKGSLETSSPGAAHEFFVMASNVPIGYYEAVLGLDPCSGKKQLYGFRYVGFIPFASCPIKPTGSVSGCCADGSLPIYGLVFERGVMTFKPLGDEINADTTRIQVSKTEVQIPKEPRTAMNVKTSTAPSPGSRPAGPVGLPA